MLILKNSYLHLTFGKYFALYPEKKTKTAPIVGVIARRSAPLIDVTLLP